MVAIFIVSFRWGLKGGLTAGFLVGALQLLYSEVFGYGFDWKVVTGIVLLDYILAYTACGLAGIFAGKARQKSDGSGGLGFVTNGILFAAAIRTCATSFGCCSLGLGSGIHPRGLCLVVLVDHL